MELSFDKILSMSTVELAQKIANDLSEPIMEKCETVDDLNIICNKMPNLVNKYSYLLAAESFLKAKNREAKRLGNKEELADIIDKSFIIHNAAEICKTKQKTLSRLVTIKQMINDEIQMI